MANSINQFLTMAIIRDQLDEVYNSMNESIIAQLPERTGKEIHYTRTKEHSFKLHVTNVGSKAPRLVVQELNRLKTLVDSIGMTIVHMQDLASLRYEAPQQQEQPKETDKV